MLAGAYVGVGKASLLLASLHPNASPVWPPTGLALAALLLLGVRYWPAILVGAFIVNVTTEGSFTAAGIIAVGNTLEAVVACLLVRHFAGAKAKPFETVHGVLIFTFLGAFLSPVVSASFGVGALLLDGTATADVASSVWLTWWLGDMVGAIVVTPLLVLWSVSSHSSCSPGKAFEACLVLLFLVFISLIAFAPMQYPLSFLSLLPVLWAALRFVPRDTSLAVVLTSVLAIAQTLKGWGVFAVSDPNSSLLFLQAFLATCAFIGLVLSASMLERRLSEHALEEKVKERTTDLTHALERDRSNAELLRVIMDHMTVATIAVSAQLKVIHMNDHFRTLFDMSAKTEAGRSLSDVLADIRLKFREPHETVDGLLRVLSDRKKKTDIELVLANDAVVYCDYIPIVDGTAHRGHLFLLREWKVI